MIWTFLKDAEGRNVYQVTEPNPNEYCMCSLHDSRLHHRKSQFARNSISMSSLSSLNLSTPSESPSPPGIEINHGSSHHMMLSMQYLNPRRPYKKPNFTNSKSNRDRRFSGTFIPEHHVIAMPSLASKVWILSTV